MYSFARKPLSLCIKEEEDEEEEEEEERSGSGDWLVLLLYMPNNKNGVRCCVLNI